MAKQGQIGSLATMVRWEIVAINADRKESSLGRESGFGSEITTGGRGLGWIVLLACRE